MTIRRISYKTFVADNFLADLGQVDWTDVYHSQDVDLAVDIFTRKFREVLNKHAPWIIFQQRKKFTPWVTDETMTIMKQRDEAKADAVALAEAGNDTTDAWARYRKLRNTVNNRLKYEENNYKAEKIQENLDCPAATWSTAKSFMNWASSSGPPSQLSINGRLVTKAASIASEMNKFFIDKIKIIRNGIQYVPNLFGKCYKIMQGKQCRLSLCHVSVSKVNKLLKKLKNSKSCSIDELDSFSIKISADLICKPLYLSIRTSFPPAGR